MHGSQCHFLKASSVVFHVMTHHAVRTVQRQYHFVSNAVVVQGRFVLLGEAAGPAGRASVQDLFEVLGHNLYAVLVSRSTWGWYVDVVEDGVTGWIVPSRSIVCRKWMRWCWKDGSRCFCFGRYR